VASYHLRTLLEQLTRDKSRGLNDFSANLKTVSGVLLDSFNSDSAKKEAISPWLQGQQPCVFGQIAARTDSLHYCFLNEGDLRRSDQHISRKIREALLAWKRRSVSPQPEWSHPAHGFVLLVSADAVMRAAPDDHLFRFASKILDLWGCPRVTQQGAGSVALETLFIEEPYTDSYRKFTFTLDYFGAQGDGKWWHDHRIPGGIGFTANSAGHMVRFHEWYQNRQGQRDWLLQVAMHTIDLAKSTWLMNLSNGTPFDRKVKCPFSRPLQLPPALQGKDWTKYRGYLYSDHCIRPEFFGLDSETPPPTEYSEDFTYLYSQGVPDHVRFVEGEPVAFEEVRKEIGAREDWLQIVAKPAAKTRSTAKSSRRKTPQLPSPQQRRRLNRALAECRRWIMTDETLNKLLQ
jgi:hypothetical protein